MLKLMLIQRNGATTHKIIGSDVAFHDFIEMVTYENFGKSISYDNAKQTVYVPRTGTTYTMLNVYGATANDLTMAG